MKKILSGIISSVIFASMVAGMSASAENIQKPNFDLNGNKCGKVIVNSEIERDVQVTVTQHTMEGDYVYYNCVIPISNEKDDYSFILEGKDDASYTIKIGVPKYKNGNSLQYYDEEFMIYDTDEIKENNVSGYEYKYTVYEGEKLSNEKTVNNQKDQNNIIKNSMDLFFPIEDYNSGDANCDNVVNIVDAAFIARKVAQRKTGELPEWADYNSDGKADIVDAATIAKDVAKRIL